MKKRFFAILLALLMFVCLLSATAFAAEAPTPATVTGNDGLVFSGKEQALVTVDETAMANCTMYYCVTATAEQPAAGTSGDWRTTVPTGKNAGTYYVWYYAKGADGYDDTEVNSDAIEVTIAKKTVSDLRVILSNKTPAYNGTAQIPNVTVKDADIINNMLRDVDFTLECADNINVGTASVTVKALEGGNYIFDDATETFTITPATVRVPAGSVELTAASRTYEKGNVSADVQFTNSAESVTINGVNKEQLIVGSVTGSVKNDSAGPGKLVTLTAGDITGVGDADPDNYKVVFNDNLKLTVDKAEFEYEAPTAIPELVATGAPLQLVTAGETNGCGTMYYKLDNGTPANAPTVASVMAQGDGTYTVSYWIKGDANHVDYGSEAEPLGSVEVTVLPDAGGSAISGGSIAIIVAVVVIAVGAAAAIVVTKKKRSGAN